MSARKITAARGRLIAVGLLCLGLLLGFVAVLPDVAGRLSGSNAIPSRVPVAHLDPGQKACQRGETLPAGSTSLVIGERTATASPAPGPALLVTVTDTDGRPVTRGHVEAGYPDVGSIGIPIDPVKGLATDVTVCVRNEGPVPMDIYGAPTPGPAPLSVAGHKASALLALIWYGAPESWLAHVPEIAHHADTGGTQIAGPLTLWVALALVLAAGVTALTLTLRESDT